MKTVSLLFVVCLAPLVLSADARGTKLSFAPAEGSTLRKSILQTAEMSLGSMKISINGEERAMDDFEQSGKAREEYVFLDEYTSVTDGELHGLVRTFEKATETQSQSMKTPRGEQSMDREPTTELEGKAVVFTWDAEAKEWKKKFKGEEGDEALLAGLDAEFDFASFLPDAEVAEGDEWELPSEALEQLQFPGGDLSMRAKDDPDSERKSSQAMRENFRGKGKAAFKGMRDENGSRVAVIEFNAEADSAWQVEIEGRMATGSEDRTLHLELKGELLWDAGARHAHGATVETNGSLTLSSATTMSRGDQSFEMKRETVLELTGKHEIKFEKPE